MRVCISFQSTLSVRRATWMTWKSRSDNTFQSTLSVRRATWFVRDCRRWPVFQSTLSVRRATASPNQMMNLRILFQSTLSVRRATEALCHQFVEYAFQSTLSVRRATQFEIVAEVLNIFQSTLSVRRATAQRNGDVTNEPISIHALRKESDPWQSDSCCSQSNFNPRSP